MPSDPSNFPDRTQAAAWDPAFMVAPPVPLGSQVKERGSPPMLLCATATPVRVQPRGWPGGMSLQPGGCDARACDSLVI